MATTDPSTAPLPGERASARIARFALLLGGAAVAAAAIIVWGWWIKLLATHARDGVVGLLEWCTVVLMCALGIAAIAGVAWSITQNRHVRRAVGHAPYAATPGIQSPPRRND